jgi:hypothetical protein
MAQAQVSERLIQRIRWLGTPDPTWTREDGRPVSPWAVAQALNFLERITDAGLPYDADPQITATARGGIEFYWKPTTGDEVDVIVPAEPNGLIEVACLHPQADGTMTEDDREAASINDAVALVIRSDS